MAAPGEQGTGDLGIVAIGRNEGSRLERCLDSLAGLGAPVVYVDSGSTDGSPERASARGVDVVRLDPARPFTAARGRNEGFRALLERHPEVRLVQFLDGDCQLVPGWIEAGRRALAGDERAAIAAGRRREFHPEASPYNRLCDMEWNTPVGVADECGGDCLARADAFDEVGGFDDSRIAGEEPELCWRLRAAGWRILRIDAEMTLHDADMHRFGQWWKRALRSGHAAAGNWSLVDRNGSCSKRRMAVSAIAWGIVLPGLGLTTALVGVAYGEWLLLPLGFLIPVAGWLLQIARITVRRRSRSERFEDSILYAGSCVVGKMPEAFGVLRCGLRRLTRKPAALVEYKGPAAIARGGEGRGA